MPEVNNPLGHEHFQALAVLYSDQPYVRDRIVEARAAAALMPMKEVLKKVPGKRIIDKIKKIGVKPATWYTWQKATDRPNKQQAKRIEQLTGIPMEKFQGRR